MERVPFREWDSFFRSCFKFIPRQGLNMAGTYLLAMIILFPINLKQLLNNTALLNNDKEYLRRKFLR
mgnify:CR=1 FL=1